MVISILRWENKLHMVNIFVSPLCWCSLAQLCLTLETP